VRFRFIAAEKAFHPVSLMCRCLGVTRSGFYAWTERPESAHGRRDRKLRVTIRAAFEQHRRRYGSPRIHHELTDQGERVSRKRVVRLMQAEGLQARRRRRFVRTTDSDHGHPVADNLLARQFTAERPNQRWVADTTEFVVAGHGKVYLAAVLDLFSRYVVGWAIGGVNDRQLTLQALTMAVKRRVPAAGLLHHSDRGCTYASRDYRTALTEAGITCSMSRRGNCYDNAVAESFFATVKTELAEQFASASDAKRELFEYLEMFYNQRRRHSTLGYLSPAAYERQVWGQGRSAAADIGAPPGVTALQGLLLPGLDPISWTLSQ
jgi:putative transposase